jgi:peptide methionine sulfoxide reductase MsrA
MGCFSFICKESGLPVASSSFDGDAVRMYLLKDGKVVEEMRGHYDSYGRVFSDSTYEDSFEWKMEWGEVVDLMFHPDESNGVAVILEKYFTGNIPTTRSESDPDQGWGKKNGGRVKIKEPIHIVY